MAKLPQLIVRAEHELEQKTLTGRQVFLVVAALVTITWLFVRPLTAGDAREYYHMWEALANHLSPELRPGDIASLKRILEANQVGHVDPYLGFFKAKSGDFYSWHFWLYPLVAVPAKYVLRFLGQNELAAFQLTNVLLLFGAVYVALFYTQTSLRRRLMFVGLAVINPVLWYLWWPSPEVFSWAMTVVALVCLHNRRYFAAALAASLGATQNPPLLLLAGCAVALAFFHTRNLKVTAVAATGFLVSFIPNIFYLVKFGTPNLIVAYHATDSRNISVDRTWSFLLDLNQGMLPYVPFVLLLFGLAVYWGWKRNAVVSLVLGALFFLMAMLSESTTNWNAGSDGMIRYAVWLLPVVAWVIADILPGTRAVQWLVTAALVSQAAVLIHGPGRYIQHGALARFVLTHAPALYNPDPEIFAERQQQAEGEFSGNLPIAFQDKAGVVTKILLNAESLGRLPKWFTVDQSYYDEIAARYRSRGGMFYLNPPRGAVLAPDVNKPPTPDEVRSAVKMQAQEVPARTSTPVFTIKMAVANAGNTQFYGPSSGTKVPLGVAYHIAEGDKMLVWDGWRAWVPQRFAPGDTVSLPVKVELPAKVGRFTVEIAPVVETVDWGPGQFWLQVDVTNASPDGYEASITPVSAEAARAGKQ